MCSSDLVSLESQEAAILYLPYLVTVDDIVSQIALVGFKAVVKSKPRPLQLSASEMERLLGASANPAPLSPSSGETEIFIDSALSSFTVTGMHCRSCVVNIQDNLAKLHGVSSVQVREGPRVRHTKPWSHCFHHPTGATQVNQQNIFP